MNLEEFIQKALNSNTLDKSYKLNISTFAHKKSKNKV